MTDTGLALAPDPWLALDSTIAPARRAEELRATWERFVEGLSNPSGGDGAGYGPVRGPIAESWQRSVAAGVAPVGPRLAPVVAAEDETEELWHAHPLSAVMPLVRECVMPFARDGGYLVVMTDAHGTLLSIEGSPDLRLRAEVEMNFMEGTSWNERGVGTNGIGVALAADHAVQVFGPEHFLEPVQRWVCAAAPVHDPDTGDVLGVVDLSSDFRRAHPTSLALVATTAVAIEGRLRIALMERDALLRSRYEDRVRSAPAGRCLMTPSGRPLTFAPQRWQLTERLSIPPGGGELVLPSGEQAVAEPVNASLEAYVVHSPERRSAASTPLVPSLRASFLGRERAIVEVGGRTEVLRPRLAEILVLLCSEPSGMTPEALLTELREEGGNVSSVRVEVSRLRKLLGRCIEPDRYRLTRDIETDVRRVEGLLSAGAVREAAAAYRGPLLPASDAPGIIRLRERLEGWLRHSVLTSDDPEALWSWLQSAGGDGDLVAWQRMLGYLPFHDPRRSRCVARIDELRTALATGT